MSICIVEDDSSIVLRRSQYAALLSEYESLAKVMNYPSFEQWVAQRVGATTQAPSRFASKLPPSTPLGAGV